MIKNEMKCMKDLNKQTGTTIEGGLVVLPPSLEILQSRRAKAVVKCTSAGQLSGPRATRKLLWLESNKVTDANILQGNL